MVLFASEVQGSTIIPPADRDAIQQSVKNWGAIAGANLSDVQNGVPFTFELGDNFPNPFNPQTAIPFEIPWQGWVKMSLVDASGKTVRTLIDRELQAGKHMHVLLAEQMPSGIYVVRLETEIGVKTKKITVAK
jgi:hypothetical protein